MLRRIGSSYAAASALRAFTAIAASSTELKYRNFASGNFEETSLSATVPVGTAISFPPSCSTAVIGERWLQAVVNNPQARRTCVAKAAIDVPARSMGYMVVSGYQTFHYVPRHAQPIDRSCDYDLFSITRRSFADGAAFTGVPHFTIAAHRRVAFKAPD